MNTHPSGGGVSLILVMCMGSATIAMRRLGRADPAEIF